jgi:hypothetical protein
MHHGMVRHSGSRRSSNGVSVFVDQSTEDAGAVHSMGIQVVDCGRSLFGIWW